MVAFMDDCAFWSEYVLISWEVIMHIRYEMCPFQKISSQPIRHFEMDNISLKNGPLRNATSCTKCAFSYGYILHHLKTYLLKGLFLSIRYMFFKWQMCVFQSNATWLKTCYDILHVCLEEIVSMIQEVCTLWQWYVKTKQIIIEMHRVILKENAVLKKMSLKKCTFCSNNAAPFEWKCKLENLFWSARVTP